jgi:hypothetical protein
MSFSGNDTQTSPTVVSNAQWWPSLAVADFQTRYRLPREYAEGVLVDGLQIGMIWANMALASWQAEQEAAGHASLSDVPCMEIGGEPSLVSSYRRAVMSYAKAYLMQQFPTINRREAANNEARESEATEDKFREYASQALAQVLGVPSIAAELI